jgi:hypothetical protein
MTIKNTNFYQFDEATMYVLGSGSKSNHGSLRDYGARLTKLDTVRIDKTVTVFKFYWVYPRTNYF